jgi:hypothetical protein
MAFAKAEILLGRAVWDKEGKDRMSKDTIILISEPCTTQAQYSCARYQEGRHL